MTAANWIGDGSQPLEQQWVGMSDYAQSGEADISFITTAARLPDADISVLSAGAIAEAFSQGRCIEFINDLTKHHPYSGRTELAQDNPYSSTNNLLAPKDRRVYDGEDFWFAFEFMCPPEYPLNEESQGGAGLMQMHVHGAGKSPFGLGVGRGGGTFGKHAPHAGGSELGYLECFYITAGGEFVEVDIAEEIHANQVYRVLVRYSARAAATGSWTVYLCKPGEELKEIFSQAGLPTILPATPNFISIGMYPDTARVEPFTHNIAKLYIGGFNTNLTREGAEAVAFPGAVAPKGPLEVTFDATAVPGDWLALWQNVKPGLDAGYGCLLLKVPATAVGATSTIFQSSLASHSEPWEIHWLKIPESEGLEHAPELAQMASDGTYLYWADVDNLCIGRSRLDGTETEPNWISSEAIAIAPTEFTTFVEAMWASPTHLYFMLRRRSKTYLARCKLDGTEIIKELVEISNLSWELLAGDSEYLYWRSGGKHIARVKQDGTGLQSEWLHVPNIEGGAMVVIGEYLYFGPCEPIGGQTYLGRVKLDGTGLTETWVATGEAGRSVSYVFRMTYDGTYLIYDSGFRVEETRRSLSRVDPATGVLERVFTTAPEDHEHEFYELEDILAVGEHVFCWMSGGYLARFTQGEEVVGGIETVNSELGEYDQDWLVDAERHQYALTVLDGYMYFVGDAASGGGDAIGRIKLDKTEYNPTFYTPEGPLAKGPNAITTDGERLYWVEEESGEWKVRRATPGQLEAKERSPVINLSEEPLALAIAGEHLYWLTTTVVGRATLEGEEEESAWFALTGEPRTDKGMASDGTYLYISGVGHGEGEEWRMARIKIEGAEDVGGLYNLYPVVGPVALDGRYIYWGHEGFVGRMTRLGSASNGRWLVKPGIVNSHGLVSVPRTTETKGAWEMRLVKRLGGEALLAMELVEVSEGTHILAFAVNISTGVLEGILDGVTVVTTEDHSFKGGYIGIEASPHTTATDPHELNFRGASIDTLEREEDPLSLAGNWKTLPWDIDPGKDTLAGYAPLSDRSGAYWNATWYGEPEPEVEHLEEPEGEEGEAATTITLKRSGRVPFLGRV